MGFGPLLLMRVGLLPPFQSSMGLVIINAGFWMHMTAFRVNEDGFLSQNRLQAQVLQPLIVRCSWGVNHELLQDDRTLKISKNCPSSGCSRGGK